MVVADAVDAVAVDAVAVVAEDTTEACRVAFNRSCIIDKHPNSIVCAVLS